MFMRPRALLPLITLLLAPAAARANPRPLPFSYPYETLPREALEVEQIVDLTPARALDATGDERWIPRTTLTTEFEYGITDRLELGFYLQLADEPTAGGDGALHFDGMKQRLRYRFADPGTWPVDVAIYGEISELRNELELEGKVILQRRLGPVRLVTNLWAEREIYYSDRREWVLHPTAGASYELAPWIVAGVEGWLLREIADGDAPANLVDKFNAGPLAFVGPTLFAQGGRGWIALGGYLRVSQFNRAARVGDRFGRYWMRAVVGIEF
jgi:hypothetical protein